LGLGVTPSVNNIAKALELQTGFNMFGYVNIGYINANAYYNGGWLYKNTDVAGRYEVGGTHKWYNAPSGTAGNAITFTQAMTLDASGNLGIGTSSPVVLKSAKTLQVFGNIKAGDDNGKGLLSLGDTASTGANVGVWRGTAGAYTGSAGTYLNLGGYDGITFTTGNADIASQTECMRIDSSGNLLVGQTSPSQSVLGFGVSGAGGTYPAGTVNTVLAGSTNAVTTWNTYSTGAGAYRFYVGMGGTIFATSIVITAISDQRLKENIRDIDTGLGAIMALKPRRFDWKEGKGQDKKNAAGFIAQEFEEVFPECVSTSKAGGDGIEYKNINHETLIPTLVKAIQEQQALITSLTARITALEST
jgi:hypothetical protein